MGSLAIATIVTNAVAWITLVVLFFWTAKSSIFAREGKDDGDDRWWDLDLEREERATLKIVFNLFILIVSCGTLFVPMKRLWSPSRGYYNRFNLGVLAAAMYLFGSMLFITFWYSANFAQDEEEENNNKNNEDKDNENDDGTNDEYTESDQQMLAKHRKIVAYMSFILAVAYSVISIIIYDEGQKLPERARSSSTNEAHGQARAAAHMEIVSELWSRLTSFAITIFAILFIATLVVTGGEEAEQMRQEGSINLITVLLWLIIVTSQVMTFGRKVLGEMKLDGTLGVGVLSGGAEYFGLLLFMVFLLYANPVFEMREKNDGVGPATALSFACFFLSLLHFTFSRMTYKYKRSIIMGIHDLYTDSVDVHGEYDGSTAGDFQRIEDDVPVPEVEMKTGSGDFKQMEDDVEMEKSATKSVSQQGGP